MAFGTSATNLLRVGIATLACGFAGVAFAAPAAAEIERVALSVECGEPRQQLCNYITEVDVEVEQTAKIAVTAAPTHCSDIIAHLYVNGDEVGEYHLAPGQQTEWYPLERGAYTVGVVGEGVPGGCNVGYLSGWGGTLTMSTPQIID